MKRVYLILAAVVLVAGAALWVILSNRTDFIREFGFAGADVKEMVETLEAGTEDRARFGARVDGTGLTLSVDGKTKTYALPEGEFYLSVAPYLDTTHACTIHNLVTCRGELANETFEIIVTDDAGTVLFVRTVASGENGFFGVWLPAGIDGTITVNHGGLSAAGAFSTFAGSATCETTLRLS